MDAMRNALLERGRTDKSVLREEAVSRGRKQSTLLKDSRYALSPRPRRSRSPTGACARAEEERRGLARPARAFRSRV